MDSQALDILRADNPWLNVLAAPASLTPSGFIPKTAMANLTEGMATLDRVHLVVGPLGLTLTGHTPMATLLADPGELDRALTPGSLP